MTLNDWIDNNPYKMALIMSFFASCFAFFNSYRLYQQIPDGFYLWLPVVWCFFLVIPVTKSIIKKVKNE